MNDVGMACDGDDPEIDSLYDHAELGYTKETVIEMSAAIVMGISAKGNDTAA